MGEGIDTRALLRLMAWLSPAFPVGGFAWSGGLERAVADRLVADAAGLSAWLETVLAHGALWNDAVLFAEAWRQCDREARSRVDDESGCRLSDGRAPRVEDGAGRCVEREAGRGSEDSSDLAELAELGLALAGTAERHAETLSLGRAFVSAASAWPDPVLARLPQDVPYPVAAGAVAAAHGVPPVQALAAYLHAALSQSVSAGIRLGVCGQAAGVMILAGLEEEIAVVSARAAAGTLDDLGAAAVHADIASLRHETQHSRLFRS